MDFAILDLPYYFSHRIFLWGCAGAIAPEVIRHYHLRNGANPQWQGSYVAVSALLVILGGIVAWILPTVTPRGACFVGFSIPILASYFFKSRGLKTGRHTAGHKISQISTGKPQQTDPKAAAHSLRLGVAPARMGSSQFETANPPGIPSIQLETQRAALIAALKARSNQRFPNVPALHAPVEAPASFWDSI